LLVQLRFNDAVTVALEHAAHRARHIARVSRSLAGSSTTPLDNVDVIPGTPARAGRARRVHGVANAVPRAWTRENAGSVVARGFRMSGETDSSPVAVDMFLIGGG